MKRNITVNCFLLAFSAALFRIDAATADSSSPQKILFIGDSFTSSQGGIDQRLLLLAKSTPQNLTIAADRVVVPGATLKRLWELGDAVRAIDTDSYDTVVVQDDIPEINLSYFRQYVRMFVEEIRQHHARPIVYMTWAYERLNWISMDEIAEAHSALAREIGIDVAPAGVAWAEAKKERPDLELFASDLEHPSPSGMYLATCVMYVTIFRKDPSGSSYVPEGVSDAQARFLQRIAWQTAGSGWSYQH